MGRPKAISLTCAVFVLLAGCQSPPSDMHDRPMSPASQPSDQSTPGSDATRAPLSSRLRDDLLAFKKAHEEGNLSDQEFSKAKQESIKMFLSSLSHFQNTNASWGEWLHDELAVLAEMKKDNLLDDTGFQEAKSALMNKYLGPESN